MSLVTYELSDSVATITMDDGKANALSFEMFRQLNVAMGRAQADGAAVVLAGRDGKFSAGFDLSVMTAGGPDVQKLLLQGFEFSFRLLSSDRPVVIACTGHAMAMGCFLLLSGDYRIGAVGDQFKIVANEVSIGMTMPYAAIEICRQRITPNHFDRVVVMSEIFNATTAVPAGFLDAVAEPGDVVGAAQLKAAALMKLDMKAFAATKARVRTGSLAAIRASIALDSAATSPI